MRSYIVKDFSTLESLKKATRQVFGTEYLSHTASVRAASTIIEGEDKLYVRKYDPDYIFAEIDVEHLKIVYQDEDIAVVSCKSNYRNPKEFAEEAFVFVLEDGKWVLGSFYDENISFWCQQEKLRSVINSIKSKSGPIEITMLTEKTDEKSELLRFSLKNRSEQDIVLSLNEMQIEKIDNDWKYTYQLPEKDVVTLKPDENYILKLKKYNEEIEDVILGAQTYKITVSPKLVDGSSQNISSYYYRVVNKSQLAVETEDPARYRVGETVQITLKNEKRDTVQIQGAPGIWRVHGTQWESVAFLFDENFKLELKPGEEKSISILLTEENLNANIIAEQYKVVFHAVNMQTQEKTKEIAQFTVMTQQPTTAAALQWYFDKYRYFLGIFAPTDQDFNREHYFTDFNPYFLFSIGCRMDKNGLDSINDPYYPFYPVELVEEIIQRYFYWDTQQIRTVLEENTFQEYYDAATDSYYFPEGYGGGSPIQPVLIAYRWEEKTLELDFETYDPNGVLYRAFTLTIDLAEDGDKLAACETTYQRAVYFNILYRDN